MFSCGDPDLDEFYTSDSIEGGKQLLAVTYTFLDDERDDVLAFFAVSNDSIKKEDVPRSAFKRAAKFISREKRYSSLPAAKIGRLGVISGGQRNGIGTAVLDFMKTWFTHGNKTGCRFLLVDSYNNNQAIAFYKRNGFSFLTEPNADDATRIMYSDLITFRNSVEV